MCHCAAKLLKSIMEKVNPNNIPCLIGAPKSKRATRSCLWYATFVQHFCPNFLKRPGGVRLLQKVWDFFAEVLDQSSTASKIRRQENSFCLAGPPCGNNAHHNLGSHMLVQAPQVSAQGPTNVNVIVNVDA